MKENHPLRARAEAHIAAAGRRTSEDHERLAGILRGWCWPGGTEDTTEAVARRLVRSRGPARLSRVELECTCAQGRCTVCN
jgi:hypothetical protein